MNGMCRSDLNRKVSGGLARGRIAAMRCLSMGPHGSQEWMVVEGLRRRSCR